MLKKSGKTMKKKESCQITELYRSCQHKFFHQKYFDFDKKKILQIVRQGLSFLLRPKFPRNVNGNLNRDRFRVRPSFLRKNPWNPKFKSFWSRAERPSFAIFTDLKRRVRDRIEPCFTFNSVVDHNLW